MPTLLHKRRPGSPDGDLPAHPQHNPSQTHHSHLSLKIIAAKNLFIAGERVTGQLELNISSTALALGELAIEFSGLNELRSLDHTAVKGTFNARIDFQGKGHRPSNAVVPNSRPINGDYYPALSGRVRFPFSFDLPPSAPSSCVLGGDATTRYELRAVACSLLGTDVSRHTERCDVRVVERWDPWDIGNWTKGVEKKASGGLKLGGEGKLELCAAVGMERGRLFWRRDRDAGIEGRGRIEVKVRVRNSSKRSVSGLKLSLCRRLRVVSAGSARPAPVVTSEILTDTFRGIGFEFASGEERQVTIFTEVPLQDECWSARKGPLFELDVFLKVQVECGFLAKDLAVELPIWIAHPCSLPPAAHASAQAVNPPPNTAPPVLPSPSTYPFPRSHSATDFLPHQPTYPFASTAPRDPFASEPYHFNEFGAVPVAVPAQQLSYRQLTMPGASPNFYPPAPIYHPPPPPPPQLDPYRQIADQRYYDVPPIAHTPSQPYYVAFDPSAPLLTQSQVFASPLPVVAPLSRSSSFQNAYPYPQVEPSTVSPPPLSPVYFPVPPSLGPPVPSPSPSPMDQAARGNESQPAAPLQRPTSTNSLRSHHTPPPPSPSSRFTPPASDPLFLQSTDGPLLETIGEDGESQAGTTKSIRALAAQLAASPLHGDDDAVRKPQANSPGRNSVQDLEEFVEDQGRMAELQMGEEKSLPRPPVPSDKTTPPRALPMAQDIFAPEVAKEVPKLPSPEPEKVVQSSLPPPPPTTKTPPPMSRSPGPVREAGGLQALEALLKRPISPDVVVAKRDTVSPSRARALSPPAPAAPASRPSSASGLRAKSMSRATSQQNLVEALEKEDPKEVLRRALASATPPPPMRERKTSTPLLPPPPLTPPTQPTRAQTSPPAATKLASSVSTPVLSAHRGQDPCGDGRKLVDVREAKVVKQEAASRIGSWLKTAEEKDKASAEPKLKISPSRVSRAAEPSRVAASPIARVAPPPPPPPALPDLKEPTVEELLMAEPPESVARAAQPRRIGGLVLPDLAKYDAGKSARGGRGGVVSSVANLWANKIEVAHEQAKPPSPLTLVPKALRVGAPVPSPLSPVQNLAARVPAPVVLARPQSASAAPTPAPSPRNRWSSPTPAKPFVNSTVGKAAHLSQPQESSRQPPAENDSLQPVGKINDQIAKLIARYSADVKSLT